MERMPEYRRGLVRQLRQQQTESVALLWLRRRAGRLDGLKFRRQRPLGRYLPDFCCDALRLVIEIDGSVHAQAEQQEYDAARDELLSAYGYRVLRISAEDVLDRMPRVLARIRQAAAPSPRPVEGEGGEPEA